MIGAVLYMSIRWREWEVQVGHKHRRSLLGFLAKRVPRAPYSHVVYTFKHTQYRARLESKSVSLVCDSCLTCVEARKHVCVVGILHLQYIYIYRKYILDNNETLPIVYKASWRYIYMLDTNLKVWVTESLITATRFAILQTMCVHNAPDHIGYMCSVSEQI